MVFWFVCWFEELILKLPCPCVLLLSGTKCSRVVSRFSDLKMLRAGGGWMCFAAILPLFQDDQLTLSVEVYMCRRKLMWLIDS